MATVARPVARPAARPEVAIRGTEPLAGPVPRSDNVTSVAAELPGTSALCPRHPPHPEYVGPWESAGQGGTRGAGSGACDQDSPPAAQQLSIQKVFKNPKFNMLTNHDDISPIKLATPAWISDSSKTPWVLQQAALPLLTNNHCKKFWGCHITNSMVCAGAHRTMQAWAPLVCQNIWTLVGIVSWGSRACDPAVPAGCARITKIHSWINSILETN